jgi:hypothetical protein
MPFRRDVQDFVGGVVVVVNPEAVGTGVGVASVKGSVGNVVLAVVVTLSYRISRTFAV